MGSGEIFFLSRQDELYSRIGIYGNVIAQTVVMRNQTTTMWPGIFKYVILIGIFILSSCTQLRMSKMAKEMESLGAVDFSFIVQPEYKSSKEVLEQTLKELYFAEEVKFGAAGIGGVIGSPTYEEDSQYWLQCVLLNPTYICNFDNDTLLSKVGADVAQTAIQEIVNYEQYDKIVITFIRKYQEGNYWKTYKFNKCFRVPTLEETELFEEEK